MADDESYGFMAILIGSLLGYILTSLTQDWKYLFLSAIIIGFVYGETYRKGMKYGFFSVLVVQIIHLLYLFLTTDPLSALNVLIAIIGFTDMGWILLLVILLIGSLIGLSGGYFGSSFRSLTNMDEWIWW